MIDTRFDIVLHGMRRRFEQELAAYRATVEQLVELASLTIDTAYGVFSLALLESIYRDSLALSVEQ